MTRREAYDARRAAARVALKADLLRTLQAHEARGEPPNIPDLAQDFGVTANTLHVLRRELASEGLVADPQARRIERTDETRVANLAERVARVRAAQVAKWSQGDVTCLTRAELRKVLP
jgi:Mn-dependent DtxR family transcriptional regulator